MRFLQSFCDESGQCDFDFFEVEDTVAVEVVADTDCYLSKVGTSRGVKYSAQIWAIKRNIHFLKRPRHSPVGDRACSYVIEFGLGECEAAGSSFNNSAGGVGTGEGL